MPMHGEFGLGYPTYTCLLPVYVCEPRRDALGFTVCVLLQDCKGPRIEHMVERGTRKGGPSQIWDPCRCVGSGLALGRMLMDRHAKMTNRPRDKVPYSSQHDYA